MNAKHKLTKITAFGLAAVMLLSGCSVSAEENTTSAGAQAPGVSAQATGAADTETITPASEITFWSTKEDCFQELCEQFKQETGITVNATYMGGYDDMVNKVMAGIAGGRLPDVAQLGQRHGLAQMYDSGALLPIEDYISKDIIDDIFPGFWKRFTYKDKKVILPFQNSMPVLYYNKDVMEANQIAIPSTFEEVMSAAKEIKEKTGIYGFTLNNDYPWYVLALIYNSGVKPVEDGAAAMDSPEIEAIFKDFQQMAAVDKSMPANQHATAQEDFCNGKVAMFMSSCASYAKIQKLADGKFEVGVAQFPSVTAMDIPMGGNGLGMFTSSPEKQKAAAMFIEFMLDKERVAGNTLKSGYIPVTNAAIATGTYKEYLTDPNREIVHNQLKYLGGAAVHPTDSLVWSEISSLLDSVEANSAVDISAELKKINEKITKYMDQYAGK